MASRTEILVECGGLRLIRSDSSAVLCMEAMRMDQVPEWMYFWSGEFSENLPANGKGSPPIAARIISADT